MVAGDFYIAKNLSDSSQVLDGGVALDSNWDGVEYDEGNSILYSNPNFRVGVGIYLIMYSELFFTSDNTNNERIEIQGEIHTVSGGLQGGFGQGYIRKVSGDQECVVSGYMILDVTAANTDIFIRFYRTDNSTSGTVIRQPGFGGVHIVQLDSANNFGLYSTSSSDQVTGTTEKTLPLDTSDRQDVGFSRSGNIITVANSGRVFCTYSLDISQTATGRETPRAYLRKNGVSAVVGSYSFSYIRGADSCQDGALSWAGIIDVSAGDTIEIRWQCPTSATITASAGAYIHLWELPVGSKTCVLEASTGDYNTNASFAWDTNPYIDTSSFSHVVGSSIIKPKQLDHCIAFATFSQQTSDSVQRGTPLVNFTIDGINTVSSSGMTYHRGTSVVGCAVSSCGILSSLSYLSDIEVSTKVLAANGVMNNSSGQFSVLSLASIFTYTFNPNVTSNDGTSVSGISFGSTMGSGKVELVDNQDYSVANKQLQSITSWSESNITFSPNVGSFPDGLYWFVVTNDSGRISVANSASSINIGLSSYTKIISDLNPDHHWTMNNTNTDSAARGGSRDLGNVGTPIFDNKSISRDSQYSLYFSSNVGVEIADSAYTNITNNHTMRYMGGWIMVDSYQLIPSSIYEEGGSINNFYFAIGFGNILLVNAADSGDFELQAYSDTPLVPNRPYHVLFKFEGAGGDGEFRLFVDGILQSSTGIGLPLIRNTMSVHAGDATFGKPDGSLDTGGTDISYVSANKLWESQWATFSELGGGAPLSQLQIREELFEKGTNAYLTIVSGTELSMQSELDGYSNSLRPDYPLAIRIERLLSGGDLELVADNITFDKKCSLDIQWYGENGETLTYVLKNGSKIDQNKISTPLGGSVVIVNSPLVSVNTVKAKEKTNISGVRVLLLASSGGDLPVDQSVSITRTGTTATVTHSSHGLRTGQKILIKQAGELGYNGIKTITVTDINTYTYLVSGSESTPATGNPIATAVIISGVTDANGIISSSHRYTSDQPVFGRARLSSSYPNRYKTSSFSGTITYVGLDLVSLLISDE